MTAHNPVVTFAASLVSSRARTAPKKRCLFAVASNGTKTAPLVNTGDDLTRRAANSKQFFNAVK